MRLVGKWPLMTRRLELPLANRVKPRRESEARRRRQRGMKTRAREREFRPVGVPLAGHATSTSRTARCGPACRDFSNARHRRQHFLAAGNSFSRPISQVNQRPEGSAFRMKATMLPNKPLKMVVGRRRPPTA